MENTAKEVLKIVLPIILELLPKRLAETLKLIGGILIILIGVAIKAEAFQMLVLAGVIGGGLYLLVYLLHSIRN